MTEVYEYTGAPRRRDILDTSRGTKNKAVFRENGSPTQDESGSEDMKIAGLFRMLSERMDSRSDGKEKRFKKMDNRFESFQEDIKNTNQRLEELQLWMPRPYLADMDIQEGSPVGLRRSPPRQGKEDLLRLDHSDSSRCYRRNHRVCRHNRR